MSRKQSIILQLDKIAVRHQDRIIFKDTSWKINVCENWAVIGENGSGKTKLIKAVLKQLPLAQGKITGPYSRDAIEFVSFHSIGAMLQKQGSFYQSRWTSFMNDEAQSVAQFLSFERIHRITPGRPDRELPQRDAFLNQEEKVVAQLQIKDLYPKKLIQLSNGELRKILIAQSLLKAPGILILDNPFMGLDQEYQKKLGRILTSLIAQKIQIVLLLDNSRLIPAWITHLLWVKNNGIVAKGPVKKMLSQYPVQQPKIGRDKKVKPANIDFAKILIEQKDSSPCVLVQLFNARVIHGEHRILDKIDWEIKKGEHWALMGPNGSGKSTLLSLILGDNPQAYANEIHLFGQKRGTGESIWDIKKKMGFVAPELQSYYPGNFNAFDVVCSGFFDSIGFFKSCTSGQKETALKWMEVLGVSHLENKLFGRLSNGDQRILLLARALVKNPTLLILDEPCQDLDAVNRAKVLAVVEQVAKNMGTTLIFVTHIPDEIPCVTTHMLVLEQGKVKETKHINT
ncbi:MAG: ATP-binding cassette domain-containing protein [Desulfobacteraceae bacterium]|nr:ATP-binding cassette domain-containing protein [Desulfobacteraceae bacterium]